MIVELNTELESARERLACDLASVVNLRPLSATALRINEACRDENLKMPLLIEMIECDPCISTRILSLVNSPLYGFPREINSLNQAVVVLGFKRLSELVTSIATKQVFEMDSECKDNAIVIFEHSLACATAARVLFQRHHSKHDSGAAFLAGMLHDVGKLFFFDLAPKTYPKIQLSPNHPTLIEQELILFGKSHCELGMQFAISNRLPVSIRTAIEQHHRNPKGAEQSILAENTELANALVKAWGIGSVSEISINQIAAEWIDAQEAPTIEVLQESIGNRFDNLRTLFLS